MNELSDLIKGIGAMAEISKLHFDWIFRASGVDPYANLYANTNDDCRRAKQNRGRRRGMKTFTVYQPYAYAICAGLKGNETRPRRTNIRGRVAVHAGKMDENRATKHLSHGEFWELMAIIGKSDRPRGAIIGTVEIVACVPIEQLIDTLTGRERLLGDYTRGRYAWVLKNPVLFSRPIPARGKQGWWNWDEREESENV